MAILAGGTVVAVASGKCVLKMAPMIQRNMDMRETPMMRGFFRPNRSTPTAMKIEVVTILTIPYTPDASKDVFVPLSPIDWKIIGA
jgi:hypothetical protein